MWQSVSDALAQSWARVLESAAALLPAAAVMLVAILAALVLGSAARWILTRALRRLEFDQRLNGTVFSALAEWSPDRSPARLLGRVVLWAFLLCGVLVGLTALDPELLGTLVGRLIDYLPNVFVAILLLLAGRVLAQFLSRGVLIGAVNLGLDSAPLLSMGVRWLVQLLAIAMALEHLHIGGVVLRLAFGILFGGIVLTLALAVGIGSTGVVRRGWAAQAAARRSEPHEAPFQHL